MSRRRFPPAPETRESLERTASFDLPLLAAVLGLLGLGVVMVYSATINEDTLTHGDGLRTLKTHVVHVGVAMAAMAFATFFPYRRWAPLVYPGLLLVIGLLGLVMIIGTEAGRATRWLSFPGFAVQPAELAKLAFVVFLAYSLAKKGKRVTQFAVAFIPHLMVCGVLILFCLFQPDFGTCIILVLLLFTMLFVAGTRLAYISLFACVAAFVVFQAVASNDMRIGRILAFIDPWAHRSGYGYQTVQSLVAIGSGGLGGQGLGYGGQTLTGYLPEGHTDFILSVLAEQMGFMGVSLVVLAFGAIVYRGVTIAGRARDDFGTYLAFGLTLLVTLQAVINMMVAVKLVPTKGLTLPFVSYGGSSMVVCCVAIGIVLNISRDIRQGKLASLTPKRPSAKKTRRRRRVRSQTIEEVIP